MPDAPHPSNAHSGGRERIPAMLLLVLGVTTAIAGVIGALAAKGAADQSIFRASVPTLPVHVYTQYTQRAFAPDYTAAEIGLAVVALGVLAAVIGIIVTARRRRLA